MQTYKSSYTKEQFEQALGNIVTIGADGNWHLGTMGSTGAPASPRYIPTVSNDGKLSWAYEGGPMTENTPATKQIFTPEVWIFTLMDGTTVEKVVPML